MQKGVDYIGVAVGTMVFDEEGRVLICLRGPDSKNEKGKREFPGGSVDWGEKCEDAAVREVKEECGIDIEITGFLCVVDHILPGEGQHWISPAYTGKRIGGEVTVMEPHKISEIKWVDLNDIGAYEMTEASKGNLVAYFAK